MLRNDNAELGVRLDEALVNLHAGHGDPLAAIEGVAAKLQMNHDRVLFEKCQHCHLFVEENHAYDGQPDTAEYVHLERGDAADERVTATHDAEPSGLVANLATWRVYGPTAMRERFVTEPKE